MGDFLDVLGTTVETGLLAFDDLETELGRNCNLIAKWSKCFANQFFVGEGAVDLGGIKERDATLDGRTDNLNALLFVDGRTVAEAQAHAAESDGGDLQVGFSEFADFHSCS